jgi:hypothetical protein
MERYSTKDDLAPEVGRYLRRQRWMAEGRFDAYSFALECNGDLRQLAAKIDETEALINKPSMREGPMSPNAGPGIHAGSYLATLREIVEAITKQEPILHNVTNGHHHSGAEAESSPPKYATPEQTEHTLAEDQDEPYQAGRDRSESASTT